MQKITAVPFFVFLYLAAAAQQAPYSTCPGCWDPDSLGNHRVVLAYSGSRRDVADALISWRRRDMRPEDKRIIVQDSATGRRITNVSIRSLTRESGDILFEPVSGTGTYYLYYMPYRNEGRSNYPKGAYWRPDTTADAGWLMRVSHSMPVTTRVVTFQAIDSFNTFYPMEVIATAAETAALRAKYKDKDFLVFPELREYPIRMRRDLPYRWIRSGPGRTFDGSMQRGEYYSFQLGVYAMHSLRDVRVAFQPLATQKGATILTSAMICINTDGVSYDGRTFRKTIDVPAGEVQPLWCVVHVPSKGPGDYSGTVAVLANGRRQEVRLRFHVGPETLKDGGVGDPAKMTRLQWLNSTLAQDNTVIAPYTPLQIVGDTLIRLLGRDIRLSREGFPDQISTFFTPEMTGMTDQPTDLLAERIHFHFVRPDGKDMALRPGQLRFTKRSPGTVSWTTRSTSDSLQMEVDASLEFDGFLSYTVKVIALAGIDLKDIEMHIPFQPAAAKYLMGLGRKGGYRPDGTYRWKWDVAHKNQDGAWIGTVNAGLQYSLRDNHYGRPLNTNFYLQKPLVSPASWANGDRGGIDVGAKGRAVLANNYSGPREMKKGDTLFYNFNLLVTPFHPLNTDFQWATRFYHRYNDVDSIKATGATIINIHQGTPINPWINYPFIEWPRMKAYID
ncbi:MAG TPA: glycoside hydrolase domain-containing protein, partial [Puia sp.]|nr:glycoside hydrolase domain-containing protein [Puia sp.]